MDRLFQWQDDELSDEERDAILERIARGIVQRGMAAPAVLFLEMNKPLSFLASQSLIVLTPFLAPFVGIDNVYRYSRLLEKRENVERLIERIEQLEHEKGQEPSGDATRL
ncbi:MAG: hypothetical protein RMM06_05305 [Armatimonadota bacterium]|nr:hypothetical protein [bacterium]MCS7309178.1 hypothetical protein [Armatimonadota bacterium]MDW8105119.1 hypothetical protein [Armatimonadota bacterium]MDW8290118.1 hypothetical protein [Armatimonadota bacterium]